MYRRERKGSISSVATAKNHVSLFQNLSDVITETENMKLDNELLPGFKKYVDDIYGYVMTCYELLPENEKVDFLNLKEKYEKEFNALW